MKIPARFAQNGLEQSTLINTSTNLLVTLTQELQDHPVHCVLVDEAQFLSEEQVLQLCSIVDDLDVPVIAYGLRADFRGELFPGSKVLLAFSDSIEEIKTICWCGKKAIMNTRLLNGIPVYEGEQILIGGNESYISLCRKHWRQGKTSSDE